MPPHRYDVLFTAIRVSLSLSDRYIFARLRHAVSKRSDRLHESVKREIGTKEGSKL
jgi:hypothetical protein